MYWFDHEWPSVEPGRPMGPVTGIAEDDDGVLYVLGRGRAMEPLIALSPEGKFLRAVRTWDDGLFGYPHGLRIDVAGNLWATDLETNQVHKLDRRGRLLLSLGRRGERGAGRDRFDAPTDVAFGPDGHVLVADGHRTTNARIVEFDAAGHYVGEWGRPGARPGELRLPHSLVVGPDGPVYVCDRHNFRIQVFDLQGRTLAIWTNVGEPHWIDVGPTGDAWLVVSNTACNLATAGEEPIRNLSYSASLSRLIRYDLRNGQILGGLEAQPATGNHAVTVARNGGLFLSSLTRGITSWQPGMHPAFEGEWGNVREKSAEAVQAYIPGAGTTTGRPG
jgi:DNA-binding beta-propeller fold protein YncE